MSLEIPKLEIFKNAAQNELKKLMSYKTAYEILDFWCSECGRRWCNSGDFCCPISRVIWLDFVRLYRLRNQSDEKLIQYIQNWITLFILKLYKKHRKLSFYLKKTVFTIFREFLKIRNKIKAISLPAKLIPDSLRPIKLHI